MTATCVTSPRVRGSSIPRFAPVWSRPGHCLGFMAVTLTFEQRALDPEALYARMWSIGVDDVGDGTRLFRQRHGGREALKWLIEDLSGAVADPVRTTRANNALRQQVHRLTTLCVYAKVLLNRATALSEPATDVVAAVRAAARERGRANAGWWITPCLASRLMPFGRSARRDQPMFLQLLCWTDIDSGQMLKRRGIKEGEHVSLKDCGTA